MYLNILSFLAAIGAIYFGYSIGRARKNGQSASGVRKMIISFILCLIVLWFINIYIGYMQ